ncbi:MAG: phosphatase PAP2/dual specificity phosphatase family protein [Gemmataceae bacterium]
MKVAAAKTSLFLSLMFLAVYGATSWITAQRVDVRTCYFEWERAIPFVPLLIVPYLSIDLFFIAAPFLCSDYSELRTLAQRIIFAIAVSGVCFLCAPMRFAFERPQTSGWLGVAFDGFRTLDAPYNLVPALHISLCIILAAVYGKYTRGMTRFAVCVWFSLIAFSTVMTYQHHVSDVAGGLILGSISCYLFREDSGRQAAVRNVRVGFYYGLGATAVFFLSALYQPQGALLLWPGLALTVVTMAYWGVGPSIFGKTGGRLPVISRFILGPALLGQYLSLIYYRRRGRRWDVVVPRLIIGGRLTNAEADEVARQGVTAVLDLTAEFSEAAPFLGMTYRNLQILDLTAPTQKQLWDSVIYISEQRAYGTVYVHCKIGYSRSAAVVCAYLLAIGTVTTAEEAVDVLRERRPGIVVRPEAWAALRAFERVQKARPSADLTPPSFCEIPSPTT